MVTAAAPVHAMVEDWVMFKLDADEEKTKGGIIIPETARDHSRYATVVAVGPGKLCGNGARTQMQTKKDDRILVGGYCGVKVIIDGIAYRIGKEADGIFGIIE